MKIRKLPSGKFTGQIMVDGTRYSITRETKQDVELAAAEIKAKKARPVKTSCTLSQIVDIYISDHEAVLSPSTIRGYKIISKHRFQKIMPIKAANITDRQWQAAINEEAKSVSPRTIKNSWSFISSTLRYSDIPQPKIKLPAVIKKERPFLTPEQIKTFISAIKGKPIEIPALLALHGLRLSEILAMDWSKIDLDKGTLTVAGSIVRNSDNHLVYKDANKTSASRRVVPIMIPALKDALQGADKTKPLLQITNNQIYTGINDICKENDLPLVGVHGCRHSFASLCFYNRVPEKICQRLGGWDDPQTLNKIYTHLAAKDIENEVEKLNRFFE